MIRIIFLSLLITLMASSFASTPKQENTANYSTIQQFSVINSGYREYQGQPAAWVMLSKPINRSLNINQYFSLSNSQGLMPGAWQLDEDAINAYYINIKPDTNYTIEVSAALTSKDNTLLEAANDKNFTSPSISPSASFIQQGSILNPNFSNGLPIMVVNVPWVEVDYYRVNTEYYWKALKENYHSKKRSWSAQRIARNGTLVSTQKYETASSENKKLQRVLKTDHIDALTQPGIYMAVMRTPNNYVNYQVTRFTVSQLGHEIREYKDHYLVTITTQKNGKTVSNVSVKAFDYQYNQLNSAQFTNKHGQVKISKYQKLALLTSTIDSDFTAINLNQSQSLNLNDFQSSGRVNSQLDLFIFGARDLYRRGEKITYYALLRNQDGRRTQDISLQAELNNSNGNTIKTAILKSDNGLYKFDHQLRPDGLTGQYQLSFKLADQYFNHQFNVEDFMPQRLDIKLGSSNKVLTTAGDNEQLLTGLFLYGAPASHHKAEGLLQLKTTTKAVLTQPNFYFGEHTQQGIIDSYEIAPITLDEDGKGSLKLEDRWRAYNQALTLNGFAYLYEKSGRKITKEFQHLWWPHQEMIGIKPHFKNLTSDRETTATFDIIRSDIDGNLANDNLIVSLIRHHKEYYWEHSNQGGWQRHYRNNVYPVWQQSLTLSNDTPLTISAPVAWGKYELEIKSTIDNTVSRLFFDAGEQWYWRWAQNNNGAVRPDQINMALDKASYIDGDIAKIKIDSPYAGKTWLRVESDDLLWQQQVTLKKGINNINVPIKDWQRHDVYLTAYLISPMTKEKAIKRAIGLIHLPLNREERALDIVIDAPKKIQPNQVQQVRVKVNNGNNKTRVVLAAVDVGILNLHHFKTPDPLDFFFGQRQYNIAINDNFNDIIAPNDYKKANILWGGGAEMARGGKQANAKVQIVSILSSPTSIDSITKEALFDLQIPYFNGRLRLFAIAFNDDSFASEMQPLIVADDVVSQINMPRFLAIGDKSQIQLDLTNTTNIEQILTISTVASELLINNQQTITLAPKENHTLSFTATPKQATNNANIDVNIMGDHYQATRQWQLAVRHPYPAQRRSNSQTLKEGASLTFSPEIKDWHQDLQSSVSIATRPQFDLTEQVNQLYQFPLGCLEQTSSRLYPWLVLPPATQHKLQKNLVNIDRDNLINDGITRILNMQTYNGSLSLWSSAGNEAPWLSAYGAQVLLRAKEAGIYVPEKALEKLLSRLAYYLRRGNFSGYGDMKDYRFSTQAYSALVLASISRANQSHMRQLIRKVKYSKSPLAVVQLAAAFELMGDPKRSKDLIDSAKTIVFKQVYNGTYSSKIRDNALIIHLLLTYNLDNDWAQTLAFSLWKEKQSRHWFSTQERLALVLADSQLETKFGDNFNYSLKVAETTFTGPDKSHAFYRVDGQAINTSTLTNTSDALLFVDQISQGYPLIPPEPQGKGIDIRRDYYDLSGHPVDLNNINSGDQYIVHIRVRSKKSSLKDIMVIDLLPAGLEIENSKFDTSIDMANIIIEGKKTSDRIKNHNIDYQGYLDDRYIASISVNSYQETELFYQVQAVTPGTYKHPPVMAESMYRHDIRAVGENTSDLIIK